MKPHKMWGFIWNPNCLTFRLYISKKIWVETMNSLKILKETNIWKNYPACKELNDKDHPHQIMKLCSLCSLSKCSFFLLAPDVTPETSQESTKRAQRTQRAMQLTMKINRAKQLVREGTSFRKAARMCGVNSTTLHNRLKGRASLKPYTSTGTWHLFWQELF